MKFTNIWEKFEKIYINSHDGIKEVRDYKWYFCVKKDDAIKNREYLEDLAKTNPDVYFEDDKTGWMRIYVPYNRSRFLVIDSVKAVMPTYEADVKLWMRYLIDEELELETDMSVLYFDIETEDLKRGISPGEERILSIAAVDNNGKEYFWFSIDDESKVLKPFIKTLGTYDILSGWHSEGFDLVAIARRCEENGIPFDCYISSWSAKDMGGLDSVRKLGKDRARPEKFNHIDLMQKIKEMHYRDTELIKKVRSFSLNAVSKAILGEEKVDLKGMSMYNLARQDPDKLKEYNMQDVMLLKKLDDKLNVTKQKIIEHHICGARINDYTSHGKIDPFALRAAKRFGSRLPSRPDKEEIEEAYEDNIADSVETEPGNRSIKAKGDYAGGYVFPPETGLHKDIHVFDFTSLYPSIIKTFNISIDSWLGKAKKIDSKDEEAIVLPTGETFSFTPGIIPKIIQELLDARDNIRHKEMKKVEKNSPEYWNLHYRQYAFKVLANSMYGIMGANFSRYYKRELAEGITLTGQHLLKTIWKWIEDRGHHPIYGDTDSLFIKFSKDEDPEKLAKEADDFLQEYLVDKFNANRGHLHLNYEATYDRFIMVAKKKYVGITESGEWKMMGVEAKKRDTLPKAEEWQRELLTNLLTKDYDINFWKQWVKERKELVYNGSLTKEEITFQKRLSREVEDYGGISKSGRKLPVPRHVRVAIEIKKTHSGNLDKLNLFSAGSYIPFIITDAAKKQEVYAEDFKGEYDREYYWEMCYAPTRRILEVVFPNEDWTFEEPRPIRRRRKKDVEEEQEELGI